MSQLTFVVTLPSNGASADGDDVASLLVEIRNYLNGKNLEVAELSDDSARFSHPVPVRDVASGATETHRFRVPATTKAWQLVELQYAFESASAGTPVLDVDVTDDGTSIFSTTPNTSTAATLSTTTSFPAGTGGLFAAGSEIVVTLDETSSTGNCQDVSVTLVFKIELDS